jgi:PleD family two-component response regulator
MRPPDKSWRPFVVLTAAERKLPQRALHSVLEESGYAVLGADTGRQALELAHASKPDAVLLDTGLSDISAVEVCRRLSGDPDFSATTPIILLTSHGTSRRDRLDAYASGAWDLCSHPLDGTALLLKLQIYLRARQAGERLRDGSLIDETTGLYNMTGLERRAGELVADARRRQEPLACIAIVATREGGRESADIDAEQYVAGVCAKQARGSDVIGRMAVNEFGLLAPATAEAGAVRIIQRLRDAFAASVPSDQVRRTVTIRASYRAASDFTNEASGPIDMLLEARRELAPPRPRDGGGLGRIRGDEAPPPPDQVP